jgi:hypothetical protein
MFAARAADPGYTGRMIITRRFVTSVLAAGLAGCTYLSGLVPGSSAPASPPAAPPARAHPVEIAPDPMAQATAGYDKKATFTGELSSFQAIPIASETNSCHVVTLRLQPGAALIDDRLAARWGKPRARDPKEDRVEVKTVDNGAIISLGCLIGKRDILVRVASFHTVFDHGKESNDPPGKGAYEATLYSRVASQQEVDDERAAVKRRDEEERQRYAEREQMYDSIKQTERQLGCPDCRQARDACLGGNPSHSWKVNHLSCDQGFQQCLQSRDLTIASCRP